MSQRAPEDAAVDAGLAQEGCLLVDEPAPGVARLTISNRSKRGALDHAILDSIAATVPTLDHHCLILTGRDGMFSAGYDLGGLDDENFAVEAERLIAHPFTAAIQALENFPYPTIAALSGHAIGGGLELALSCDLRIAAAGVRLGMPPAKLGLVYSYTGIQKFVQIVGAARTRELFLLATYIDAAKAERWGLVNQVVERDKLVTETIAMAQDLTTHAPLSLTGNKRVIGAVLAASDELDPELEQELIELRRACFESEDILEGVRAFNQKRPARWRGH